MTDQTSQHHVLIIDYWENGFGKFVALVLQRKRGDRTQLIVGGDQGLQAVQEDLPDAVFIYLWAHDPGALEFCQQIRDVPRAECLPVIVWGAKSPSDICSQLRDVGATGYLYQPCTPDEVLAARDAALKGETYYPTRSAYNE